MKSELVTFCKEIGISTNGGKIELTEKIKYFLTTGKVKKQEAKPNKSVSKFDWNTEILTATTIITDNYKNTENVRQFFTENIGTHFSFNVKFMNWMKVNVGKTLNEAMNEWKMLRELNKDKNYKTEIKPQFEYNRYMRAFLADNPNLSSKDAMKFWKLKRAKRGTNEYEQTDLTMK